MEVGYFWRHSKKKNHLTTIDVELRVRRKEREFVHPGPQEKLWNENKMCSLPPAAIELALNGTLF